MRSETELSQATLTSMQGVLGGLSASQVAATASTMGLSAAQTAAALKAAGMTAEEIAAALAARGFSEATAIAQLKMLGFSDQMVASAINASVFTGSLEAAEGATLGLSNAFVGLGAVIKAHPILFTISALLAIVPLAIKLFDDWTVSAEEAAEAIKVRDRRNSRFPSIAATAAAVDGFACSDQAPCPVDTTRSGGDGGGTAAGTSDCKYGISIKLVDIYTCI